MTQQNFFQLLNLSVDPPEEDAKIIKAAIKKKQTAWSRVRNHPTKGIQAKRFLDLIPEIRKVMLDPVLRKEEARKAKRQQHAKDELKASEIDRHLAIYFTKGSVTDDEIKKLQTLHSVEVETILRRVIQKEKELKSIPSSVPGTAKNSGTLVEKLAEIDKSLGIQMRKGYVTNGEISSLAEAYSISQDEIINRTTYPVRENNNPTDIEPKTIDKTIEKVINRNLKLLEKSSLYEFLDLPVNSGLASLKNRAEKLRAKAIAAGQKNAMVTASAELAGHCSTIFKSEKTRTAYDVSKALADLDALNTDIAVAEMEGVIRAEYFEALHKTATELGMGADEACSYIEAHCLDKNWVLKSKQKRRRQVRLYATIAASVFIVIAGTILMFQMLKHNRLKNEYQSVLAHVKNQTQLEKKRDLLSAYLDTHDQGKFTDKAEKKFERIQINIKKRDAIDKRDYGKALKQATGFHEEKAYEKAGVIYKKYLKNHPQGHHVDAFKQKIAVIPGLIDDRDFQNLTLISPQDFEKRIAAYNTYLTNHPEGKYRDQTEKMISDMSRDYYRYIARKIKINEKEKNWEECIRLCDSYLTFYKESDRAVDIEGERYFFQKQLNNSQLLEGLMQMASRVGRNNVKARQVYLDYLSANPDSPIKYEVKREIAKLDKRRSKYR